MVSGASSDDNGVSGIVMSAVEGVVVAVGVSDHHPTLNYLMSPVC